MSSRRLRRPLALTAGLPLLFAACLGGGATSVPSTAPATVATTVAPSATADVTGTVTFWNGYAADGDE
ncbi:MAG: hypothetical protein ABIV26_09465, partial [Candidatus Limnocylindrales bacterium]